MLNKHNQNGTVLESYKAIYKGGDKNLFFLYSNMSLLLTLFRIFKAIDSAERDSSNKQPRYVTA